MIGSRKLAKFLYNNFGIGLLIYDSTKYFTDLYDTVLRERLNGGASGNDFIQTLIEKRVEASEDDSTTEVDSFGNRWSPKGSRKNNCVDAYISLISIQFNLC